MTHDLCNSSRNLPNDSFRLWNFHWIAKGPLVFWRDSNTENLHWTLNSNGLKPRTLETRDRGVYRMTTLKGPTNLHLSYHTFWYWWYSNVGYNREFLERFRILKFNPKLNLIQPLECIKSRLISQMLRCSTIQVLSRQSSRNLGLSR